METDDAVSELLERLETADLEFKRDQYPLESDAQKAAFLKDVICLANTPRDAPAHLVIGVETQDGRPTHITGAEFHHDPAVLSNLIAGKTDRGVHFTYRVLEYQGKSLGVIAIPRSRNVPVMVRARIGDLDPGTVWTRRVAQNAKASSDEIRRLAAWAEGIPPEAGSPPTMHGDWERLYRACDGFDPRRLMVAIIDRDPTMIEDDWRVFARVGWRLVVDLDRDTDESGAYASAGGVARTLHSLLFTALEEPQYALTNSSSVWVAANGVRSRPTTLRANTRREWNQILRRPLARLALELSGLTEPAPVTIIVLAGEAEYVESVCGALDEAFGSRTSFVVASRSPEAYSQVAADYDAVSLSLSFPEVCRRLRETIPAASAADDLEVPRLDDGTAIIPADRARWLEEEMDVVHLRLGLAAPSPATEQRDFLRGLPISWFGLNTRVDIDRDLSSRLEQHLLSELSKRSTLRTHLRHWPGGGGTTVAHRVAWNIRDHYPVVLARQLRTVGSAERIRYIFDLTKLPVLVVVDGGASTRDDLEKVYAQLRSSNVPAVILQVERHISTAAGQQAFYLDAMLSNREAVTLADRLAQATPGRRRQLQQLVTSTDRRQRTPFYFGLVAFEQDFAGIEHYVEQRLADASEPVRKICRIAALIYHYGQQETPLQMLGPVLMVAPNRLVKGSDILPGPLQDLFVDLLSAVRPAHDLIAEELLAQLLTPPGGDKRAWRTGLADAAVEVISLAASGHLQQRGAMSQLMRAVLIERGSEETPSGPWEGQFSRLVNDIPSPDGRRRVVEALTEHFPDEPHFWAHLGRLYTRLTHDYARAHEAHRRSIELEREDPLLHHMWGMAWRAELYDRLERLTLAEFTPQVETEIWALVGQARDEFSAARALEPRSEYNYVSEIQIAIRVIGRIVRLRAGNHDDVAGFLTAPGNTAYRELLDDAETLFSELSAARAGEEPSRYFRQARPDLDAVYGDYARAIQGWTNLLDRKDVFRPPVRRQIIRAYLARRSHRWSGLSAQELERALLLAQENLLEEPDSDQNLRLWFSAQRFDRNSSVTRVAEQLANRRLQHPSIDTLYYLYILRFLQAEAGELALAQQAEQLISECSRLAQPIPQRTHSFEWLGTGQGLNALVHESDLGDWDSGQQFWKDDSALRRIHGRIARVQSPASGEVELPTGLKAFFVPARGLVQGGYIAGQDIGRRVEFSLGFSYDGLRAWSVGDAGDTR